MPSLMDLIFSKRQRRTFLTHQAWGLGDKILSPWLIFSLQVTGPPFSWALCVKTGFCCNSFLGFFIWIAWRIFCRQYSAAFSTTNKMYFICSNSSFFTRVSMRISTNLSLSLISSSFLDRNLPSSSQNYLPHSLQLPIIKLPLPPRFSHSQKSLSFHDCTSSNLSSYLLLFSIQ